MVEADEVITKYNFDLFVRALLIRSARKHIPVAGWVITEAKGIGKYQRPNGQPVPLVMNSPLSVLRSSVPHPKCW